MTTEITESAKLAEEYYGKTVECTAHIESCAGKIRDLGGRLSSFNAQIATSARQSLSAIRSSVDSLLSTERSNRPVDSIGAAVLEVEQLKREQMQLGRRYDRLLSFLRMHARQTEQSDSAGRLLQRNMEQGDGAGHLPQQNVDSCDDMGAVSDEVLLLSVPGSVNADELDTNVQQRVASGPSDGTSTTTPPSAADGRCPVGSAVDGLASHAADAVVADSSSTRPTSSRKNATGIATRSRSAKRASAGHVQPTATRARRKSSSADRKSSTTRSRGTNSGSQGTSSTSAAAAPSASSPGEQVESTEAEFKRPQSQSRGRLQVRQRSTACTKSADSAVQSSSISSDTASSGETTVVKAGRKKRSNSAVQNGIVGNDAAVAHEQNVNSVVGSADVFQSAVLSSASQESGESGVVKTRRRRTNSAAVASTKKTPGRAIDGKVMSRRGRRWLTGGGSIASARRRNYSSPVNGIQSRRYTSRMNLNMNGDVPVAATAVSPMPSYPVTTYLSGPRTDIFRQHSPQSPGSTVQALQSDSLQSLNAVDSEVAIRAVVTTDISQSVSATGYAVSYSSSTLAF